MVILLIPVSLLRNHTASDIITLSNKRVRYGYVHDNLCGAHRYWRTGAARFFVFFFSLCFQQFFLLQNIVGQSAIIHTFLSAGLTIPHLFHQINGGDRFRAINRI